MDPVLGVHDRGEQSARERAGDHDPASVDAVITSHLDQVVLQRIAREMPETHPVAIEPSAVASFVWTERPPRTGRSRFGIWH